MRVTLHDAYYSRIMSIHITTKEMSLLYFKIQYFSNEFLDLSDRNLVSPFDHIWRQNYIFNGLKTVKPFDPVDPLDLI